MDWRSIWPGRKNYLVNWETPIWVMPAWSTFDQLTRLEWLGLEGTPITDAAVERLTKLQRLEGLVVVGTKLTPAGIERLGRALPNCKIDSAPPDARALKTGRQPRRFAALGGNFPLPAFFFLHFSGKEIPCRVPR